MRRLRWRLLQRGGSCGCRWRRRGVGGGCLLDALRQEGLHHPPAGAVSRPGHPGEAARKNAKVELITNTTATEVKGGDGQVKEITLKDVVSGQTRSLTVTGLFVFIGFTPNVQFFDHRDHVEHDPLGFLVTDSTMQTSLPGVYAAGDVRSQLTRQITTAVGDATTAAIDAVKKLEAKKHEPTPVPVDLYGPTRPDLVGSYPGPPAPLRPP